MNTERVLTVLDLLRHVLGVVLALPHGVGASILPAFSLLLAGVRAFRVWRGKDAQGKK
jgi:hypothetical protein